MLQCLVDNMTGDCVNPRSRESASTLRASVSVCSGSKVVSFHVEPQAICFHASTLQLHHSKLPSSVRHEEEEREATIFLPGFFGQFTTGAGDMSSVSLY